MKAQFIPRWIEGRRLRTIDTRHHHDITRHHRQVMIRIHVRQRQLVPLITTRSCEREESDIAKSLVAPGTVAAIGAGTLTTSTPAAAQAQVRGRVLRDADKSDPSRLG